MMKRAGGEKREEETEWNWKVGKAWEKRKGES